MGLGEVPPRARIAISAAAAAVVPFAAAIALVPLRSHSPNATVALILALVVEHQGRPLGRYVLSSRGTPVSTDELLVALALADLAGAALAAQTGS